jgi:putative peptidoglycan lipid II flippase
MTSEPEPVHLARNTAVMAGGTLLSRLTGFGRLAAMTAAFGVVEGQLADAYNKANVAPNIVYELVLGGVLSSVLIPVFVETLRRDDAEHRHVVNTVTTIAGIVLVVIALVAIVAAPWLAILFTLGAEGSAEEVAALRHVVAVFLRLFMPQVLFYGLTTIWTAYLNAHRHFAAPMYAPVLNNLVAIAVVLGFAAAVQFQAVDLRALTAAHLLLLGLGTTGGIVAMTVPLWPVARRHGWAWRPSLDWRHPMVRRIGRLGGWAVVYVVLNQIGYLVVIVLTSAIPGEGAFSAYFYAFVFFQLPHGIYAVSVMTALVPPMAAAAADDDTERFRAHLARGVRATALLIVPAAVGLAVLSTPIVRLLLEQGVFTAESTRLVAPVLTAFAVGLPSFSLFQLFLRAHYALQDTRTPALVNAGWVAVNIAVNLTLFALLPGQWKVVGLALGHAVAYTVGCGVFVRLLRRRVGGLGGSETRAALLRIAAAAAGMGVLAGATAAGMASLVGTATLATQAAQVIAAVGVGAGAYLVLARAFGVQEVRDVQSLVSRRLRR